MYKENLYSYEEVVKGKSVCFIFNPDFRKALFVLRKREDKLFSDGEIRFDGECPIAYVYAEEKAQWLLEDDGKAFHLFVTEKTNEISTPLGEEWNMEFNRILKLCKKTYYRKKKEEVRLYFYDCEKELLRLYYDYEGALQDERKYKYSLKREFPCAIDRRYKKPEKSCFVFGRVRKSIGLKNSNLLDFIEPVYTIDLDFKKVWHYEYREDVEDLGNILSDLMKFCIVDSDTSLNLEIMRIRARQEDYETSSEELLVQVKNKIREAFKNDNVKELRALHDVIKTMQDCTNVNFQLRLKSEVECLPSERMDVYFENGEVCHLLSARWIFKNINRCTDARGRCLEEKGKVDRYIFY